MAKAFVTITAKIELELMRDASSEEEFIDALAENDSDWISRLALFAEFELEDFEADEPEEDEPTMSEVHPKGTKGEDDIPF